MNRRPLLLTLRVCAIAALVMAYWNPEFPAVASPDKIPLLLDISGSMSPESADTLVQSVRRSSIADRVKILPFASSPGVYSADASAYRDFRSFQTSWASLDTGGSNLEAALSAVQGSDAVLLVSDGYEHGGDVFKELPDLAASGTHVYPLVPDRAAKDAPTFRITHLAAPLSAALNTSVPVRVGLQNSSDRPQGGTLVIRHGDKELYRGKLSLDPGKERVISVQSDSSLSGVQEIRAELEPDDAQFEKSSEVTYLSGAQREKVLLVNGGPEDDRFLRQALADQSFQVDSVTAGSGGVSTGSLENYASVIFNDVSIKQIDTVLPESLKRFVEGGGGFLMIGGPRSFGLGGYRDTPVEQILPVYLVPPETEQKRLNVGVELVLDKSQSMGANEKIEFVKEAARQVVQSLKNDDYLGLVGFDEQPYLALPIGRLSEVRSKAVTQIGTFFPTGATRLMPALQMGVRELEKAPAGRKHMIVLTDGKLPDAGPMYIEAAKQLRIRGITLSTILLGGEANFYPLREMAESGGGTFYQTTDPNALPKVFINDIKVSTGEKTLREETEYDVRKGPGGISSTTLESFPVVRGFVETRMKEAGKLELMAYSGARANPLLASWAFGRGHAAAFTSDANGRWSASWIGWPRFRQFWTEVVQSLTGEGGGADVQFELRPFMERGKLKLDLSIFTPGTTGPFSAKLVYPDRSEHSISFSALSAGHYESQVDRPLPGRYDVRISAGGKKLTPVSFDIAGESFGEQKGRGFSRAILERIARETGGSVNPQPATLSAHAKTAPVHLQTLFILLSLLLLGAEIFIRESGRMLVRGRA